MALCSAQVVLAVHQAAALSGRPREAGSNASVSEYGCRNPQGSARRATVPWQPCVYQVGVLVPMWHGKLNSPYPWQFHAARLLFQATSLIACRHCRAVRSNAICSPPGTKCWLLLALLLATGCCTLMPPPPHHHHHSGRIMRKVWLGVLTVWRALKALFSRKLWAITLVLLFMWVSKHVACCWPAVGHWIQGSRT